MRLTLLSALLAASVAALAAAPSPDVPYPDGYRLWTHVSSSPSANGGVHHIYANAEAMQGYRTGDFPDGAVIAFDVRPYPPVPGTPNDRRVLDVMKRDRAAYAATDGWGYTEFKGASRTERTFTADRAEAVCAACHRKLAPDDRVIGAFSE